jgi:hypothetical protein
MRTMHQPIASNRRGHGHAEDQPWRGPLTLLSLVLFAAALLWPEW